ncbi:MAG TPA: LETM1-related biofilm-associated protein [Brumimicrobium sp.]|nr:LETM1-related biofilm-associated protein [Brumimicrobium sp.]
MLQPGAKNWIYKYFSLIESGEVDLLPWTESTDLSKAEFLHSVFFDTGIIFGYPIDFLFCKNEISESWTNDEKLSLLLLESLILVYISERETLSKEEFIDALLVFYQQFKPKHSLNILKFFFKDSESIKLERIIKSRIHVKRSITNQLWVSYFSNSLVYLDIMAFRLFLLNEKQLEESEGAFINGALQVVATMAVADEVLTPLEQQIIATYIEASSLTDVEIAEFYQKLKNREFVLADITIPKDAADLYKLYLLDIAVMAVHSDLSVVNEEMVELRALCNYLKLPEEKLEHSIMIINRFIMNNNDKIVFLQDKSSYEQLYSNFSKRWIKILGRNKDKLIDELKESKELISLVNKSFTEELTAEEKEKVKTQFKDIIKSVPALAIFMLPGGMILLPIILKIIPDLIPSAFKKNEI